MAIRSISSAPRPGREKRTLDVLLQGALALTLPEATPSSPRTGPCRPGLGTTIATRSLRAIGCAHFLRSLAE